MTLEEILRKYFASKKRALFRKKRIWIDDLPEDLTKTGYKAYSKLIGLIYDVGELTGKEIECQKIVDILDTITTEQG